MNEQVAHILLVEDEVAHADLVRRAFEPHRGQFHLAVAGSLAEARACLAEANPALIIADLHLPDGLGTSLLPAEGEEVAVPLVVMTAHGDQAAAVEAMKAGALDYLVKSEEVLADTPHIAERVLREWQYIIERKDGERAKRDSEERFRLLFENAKDGIVIFDLDGTINDVNVETELMSGYSRDELIGSQSIIHLTPVSAQLAEERMRDWLAGEQIPPVIELEGVRKDGSIAYFEGRTQFIRDQNGNPTGYQGIFRDISERRQAEEAQRRWAEENSAMAEIGRILTSSLAIDEVYPRLSEAIARLIPFDQLEITVIDQVRERDKVAFSTALSKNMTGSGESTRLEGSITGRLADSRAGLIIQGMKSGDIESEYPCLESMVRAGFRSWLAVPLISHNESIGALFLASRTEMAFTPGNLDLAERIGNQIAGFITNSGLYMDLKQAEETERELSGELTILYDISRILSQLGDFESKAARVMERLAISTEAEWVTLRLETVGEPGLRLVAAAGSAVSTTPPIPVLTSKETLAYGALREGTLIVSNDYPNEPNASPNIVALGMKSMILIPIKAGDHTMGLVNVVSRKTNHFTPELVRLLTAVGEGLGALLENAQLDQQLQTSREELSLVDEVARMITSTLEIGQAYDEFATEVKKLVDFDRMNINILDYAEGTHILKYSFGQQVSQRSPGYISPIEGGEIEQVLSCGRSFVRDDIATDPSFRWDEQLLDAGLRSSIMLPITSNGAVIGSLTFRSRRAGAFGPAEQGRLERLANQISPAVANSQLSGIPQIKPTFLDIAPSGIPSNIIPHSKGIKCGLIRSNSPFSYSNHRPAKPKIPKPLVYAQVSPLGTSFATP